LLSSVRLCLYASVIACSRGVALGLALLMPPAAASAQQVELSPFVGYRTPGSFAEIGGAPVTSDDGGTSAGIVVDVALGSGTDLKIEGVFSRQWAELRVRRSLLDPPANVQVTVDQIVIGAVRDLSDGRARPFLSGLVGLTRYAAPDDEAVAFAVGVGTGVKFFATRHLGLRVDARGYLTFSSASLNGACAGGCALRISTSPAFQADFTAGVIAAF
jgi:hypothetical protein